MTDSPYIEKDGYLSSLAHASELEFREADGHLRTEYGSEEAWRRCVREVFPKFIPALKRCCGLEFQGRILEIGAGSAWFSAELSKLAAVEAVVATDFSPRLLKEKAPEVFRMLGARESIITRMPADFHHLDFPDGSFDFVVCSAVLHHAVDMAAVLREAARVMKPSGRFVAIREPVWPLFKRRSGSRMQARLIEAGVNEHMYTLKEYAAFFAAGGLRFEAHPVSLAGGLKYYYDRVVNGLTHARYAFLGSHRASA